MFGITRAFLNLSSEVGVLPPRFSNILSMSSLDNCLPESLTGAYISQNNKSHEQLK
jgi:hypothetical protein